MYWCQLHPGELVHWSSDSRQPIGVFRLANYYAYFPARRDAGRDFEICLIPKDKQTVPTIGERQALFFCANGGGEYAQWRERLSSQMENVSATRKAAAQAAYKKNSGSDGAASPTTPVAQRVIPTSLRRPAAPPTPTREADDSIRLEDFDRLRLLGQVGQTRGSESQRVRQSESQRQLESRAYNPAMRIGAPSRVIGSRGSPGRRRGLEFRCAAGPDRAGSARSSSSDARAATAASSR